MKKFLILAALVLAASTAAQKVSAQKVQIGARVGITSQDMELKTSDFTTDSKLGWHLAAVARLRLVGFGSGALGAGLFLQPEIVYSQNNYKMHSQGILNMPPIVPKTRADHSGETSKIRMQTIDIPLLLSAKVSIVRVQAGPVFNLMNNYSSVDGSLELLPTRPAVGYALGASVDIGLLTIDGRYHGEFKELKNNIKGGGSTYESVKGSLSSWSLGVGVMF